jgi:hypothetical protein
MVTLRSVSPAIASLILGLAALPMTGCYGHDDVIDEEIVGDTHMSFEEFEATVYQEPETGIYIVDGDTPIETREELKDFYEQHILKGALVVNLVGGVVDRWRDSQKGYLTYCVSTAFGDRYNAVVNAMWYAGLDWGYATNVRFLHKIEHDNSCDGSNANVLFDVRPTNGKDYLARAFFPSDPRGSRNILIDSASFGNIAPITLTGILRHELGHVLGFRHEHTRPEAATCFEDSSYHELTTYDSASVMHYPDCNGTNTGDLTLTQKDKDGVMSVYGDMLIIYEHASYQGMYQTFWPGAHDVHELGIGHDLLSSVKVPSGWTVKLYKHAGFTGDVKTLTADTSYVGDDWNDTTSSIIVTAP